MAYQSPVSKLFPLSSGVADVCYNVNNEVICSRARSIWPTLHFALVFGKLPIICNSGTSTSLPEDSGTMLE